MQHVCSEPRGGVIKEKTVEDRLGSVFALSHEVAWKKKKKKGRKMVEDRLSSVSALKKKKKGKKMVEDHLSSGYALSHEVAR